MCPSGLTVHPEIIQVADKRGNLEVIRPTVHSARCWRRPDEPTEIDNSRNCN
jgi:hypothetical protein